jgi:hypothetical protein
MSVSKFHKSKNYNNNNNNNNNNNSRKSNTDKIQNIEKIRIRIMRI